MKSKKIKHMKSTVERDGPRTLCGIRIKRDIQVVENSVESSSEVFCKKCTLLIELYYKHLREFRTIPNPASEYW